MVKCRIGENAMTFGKWILVGLGGLLLLALVGTCTVVGMYNGLSSADQQVAEHWALVQNQYQRRLDLIPNLVNTVKGYAKHEQAVLTQVTAARSSLQAFDM